MSQTARNAQSEHGAVLVTLVLVLTASLFLMSMVYVGGFYFTAQAQLRALADAAAHAGAAKICSSKACWAVSRIAAVQVLHFTPTKSGLSNSKFIDTSTAQRPDGSPLPGGPIALENVLSPWEFNGGDFVVAIDRGRWTPTQGFLSFDQDMGGGQHWQDAHPGVPVYAAFNAMRVTISRRLKVADFLGHLLSIRVSADSIAAADEVPEGIPVGPFAMPICSLLRQDGDFNRGYLCTSERFFTARTEYAGTGAAAGLPGFTWEPISPEALVSRSDGVNPSYMDYNNRSPTDQIICQNAIATQAPPAHFSCQFASDQECFWYSDGYPQRQDSYGVVGVPNDPASGADDLAAALDPATDSPWSARIGDNFHIVDSGFNSSAAEAQLWAKITASGGENIPYVDSAAAGGMGSLNDNTVLGYSFAYNKYFMPMNGPPPDPLSPPTAQDSTTDLYSEWGLCTANDPAPCSGVWERTNWCLNLNAGRSAGLCNSRRFGPHPVPGFVPVGVGTPALGMRDQKLWQVTIPVIADFAADADSCSGVTPSSPADDPPFPRASADGRGNPDWKVLGFVRASIYDLDVGNAPPPPPDPATYPDYHGFYWPFGPASYALAAASGGTPQVDTNGVTRPWSFPVNCNVVRAKLSCDTSLLPGPASIERRPYFVK